MLYEREGSGLGEVIAPDKAAQMNRMLTQALISGTGRKARLGTRPSAGKTGTTQDFRDAWFIGYSGDVVAGVWVGNDRAVSMKKVTGGSFPTLVWKAFMTATLEGQPVHALPLVADPDAPATAVLEGVAQPASPVAAASNPVPEPVDELPAIVPAQKDAQTKTDALANLIRANANEPAVTTDE